MNFAWSLFEFTPVDCQLLAKALKATPTLKVLRLTQSKATDERGRLLVAHLLDHPALHTLGELHTIIFFTLKALSICSQICLTISWEMGQVEPLAS